MKIFVLIFCYFGKVHSALPQYFDIQLDRFEVLYADPKVVEFNNIKVRKINKTRSIIGNISYHVPIDENMICITKVLKKQGNEYKYLPYRVPPTGLCEVFRSDGKYLGFYI